MQGDPNFIQRTFTFISRVTRNISQRLFPPPDIKSEAYLHEQANPSAWTRLCMRCYDVQDHPWFSRVFMVLIIFNTTSALPTIPLPLGLANYTEISASPSVDVDVKLSVLGH